MGGFFKLDESLISSKNEQESDFTKVVCNENKHLIESIQIAGGKKVTNKSKNLNKLLDFDKLRNTE